MDMLILAITQLTVGFFIAASLLLILTVIHATFASANYRVKQGIKLVNKPRIATVHRIGAWQYNHDFFDKIEEFRNDFA